jgi:kynurenine formamidase
MDAPSHFVTGVSSIDQIPVNRLISRTTLIKAAKASDELITASEIEASKVKILEGSSVVFSTSWENEVDNDYYFTHSPGLSEDAAEYLINKKVNAVGIDSPSIDRGSDSNFPVHKLLLSNEILIVENLCNLGKIDNQNFTLIMTPLRLSGASGSPIRAIAIDEIF